MARDVSIGSCHAARDSAGCQQFLKQDSWDAPSDSPAYSAEAASRRESPSHSGPVSVEKDGADSGRSPRKTVDRAGLRPYPELLIYMNIQQCQEIQMTKQEGCNCVKVRALVNIDERGQMVLPKEIRKKADIRGGDKLALSTIEREGKVCCILLTKSDELGHAVQATLGPAAQLG
jgi:antitoxin PrlF